MSWSSPRRVWSAAPGTLSAGRGGEAERPLDPVANHVQAAMAGQAEGDPAQQVGQVWTEVVGPDRPRRSQEEGRGQDRTDQCTEPVDEAGQGAQSGHDLERRDDHPDQQRGRQGEGGDQRR
jgi:hypothetical protein